MEGVKEEDGGGEEVGEEREGGREVEQEERVLGQAPGVNTME